MLRYNNSRAGRLPRAAGAPAVPVLSGEKSKPFFKASLRPDDNVIELVIYEEIGANYDWWTGETTGISAALIKAELDANPQYSSILIRINSPGGDALEGVAILNLLKSLSKPVNVVIDGIAASAASIIAMSGDTIRMGSGAMMMIHNAWGGCVGNTHDMAQQAAALAAIDGSIAQIYVDRSGGRLAKIVAMMDAETWMSAQDCINAGFATGMQEVPDGREALAMARGFKVMAKFNHVPKRLMPAASDLDPDSDETCACNCAACTGGNNCKDCENAACVDANCKDCPMQDDDDGDGIDDNAHGRIEVMASMLRTRPSMDLQVVAGKGSRKILALRRASEAVLNLVPAMNGKPAVAKVSGVLAPYGSLSCDLGGFFEVYQSGCFSQSLTDDDSMVLYNHNMDAVLGRKSAGTARFWDESDGLHYEADLPDTQPARDLRVLMERKDVKGASAAFYIDRYRWEMRGDLRVRVVEKARLLEGGPHSLAAYVDSTAALETPGAGPIDVAALAVVAENDAAAALDALAENRAVPSHSTSTSDKSWDAGTHENRLATTLPTATAKKVYAWIPDNPGATVNRADCKMPHHEVAKDGTPGAANVKACQSAIGKLNGGDTTIPEADRKGTYAHLAAHLRDAGEEPAPLQELEGAVENHIDETVVVNQIELLEERLRRIA